MGVEDLTFQRAWEEAGNAGSLSFMGEHYEMGHGAAHAEANQGE